MHSHKHIFIAAGILGLLSVAYVTDQRGQTGYTLTAKVEKITICHVPSNQTMEIPAQTLDSHLNHGDYIGPCIEASSAHSSAVSSLVFSSIHSSEVSVSSESSTTSISTYSSSAASSDSGKFVTLCHVSSNQTIQAPESAVSAHLSHGDYLGECASESSSESANDDMAVSEPEPINTGNAPEESPMPLVRGHGLREHAAALDLTLQLHGLHTNDTMHSYAFIHDDIYPESFASEVEASDWALKTHAAACSMYRYLERLRELRPGIDPGYVAWISQRLSTILKQDPNQIEAALLGFPYGDIYTSGFVLGIASEGCAANPYVTSVAWEKPAVDTLHGAAEGHGHVSIENETLRIEQVPADGEIIFSVMNGDEEFIDFGDSHTKEMHNLIIRDDLRYYTHIHAHRADDGLWHIPFEPPAPGTYWIYADFTDHENALHVLRFERTYEGEVGAYGLRRDDRMTKNAGKYTVELQPKEYDSGTLFILNIRDQYGHVPFLEKSDGNYGHGALLSANGDYIHTHPSPAGDAITFRISHLEEKFYRIFTQFWIQDQMHVVPFDWKPKHDH